MVTEVKDLSIPLTRNKRITAITSQICIKCHVGADARTPTLLQSEKEGFNAALAALARALKNRAFMYRGDPLNFSNTNWQTDRGNQIGGFGAGTGGRTMGAAFNFNLLRRDKGAFVHNNIYTKRLIYDSIDWITNGPGGSVHVDTAINNLPDDPILVIATNGSTINFNQAVKTAAIAYLMGTDSNPSGIGNSRP